MKSFIFLCNILIPVGKKNDSHPAECKLTFAAIHEKLTVEKVKKFSTDITCHWIIWAAHNLLW